MAKKENNHPQNTTQKTRVPQKAGFNSGESDG